ncbi:MAG: hypothetical protein QOJ66_3529 [Ilumatobacteraceae bacterium]|jgi:hypothetical protein
MSFLEAATSVRVVVEWQPARVPSMCKMSEPGQFTAATVPRRCDTGSTWTDVAEAREHPPMMLNVLANVFRVPLVLGPDGKRNAIAVRLLQYCGIEDTDTNRASAMSVIGQIAQLGENGTLDPLIGGYDRGERVRIIDNLTAAESVFESKELVERLAESMFDELVKHLALNPRDAGTAT